MKLGDLLTRHRNTFLLTLLVSTLLVSGLANRERLTSIPTVSIPVTATAAQSVTPLEGYRCAREQQAKEDIAALERLCAQEGLDRTTRESAAARLQEMIAARQSQSALEGALAGSSLYPCVAVVSGESVTIVTEKAAVTQEDSALVLTLCAAHTSVKPENVRIVTVE